MKHASSLYHFEPTLKSWFDARHHCLMQNSHLVDITDLAENIFVVKLVGNKSDRFWISLNDVKSENKFVKSNGRRPTFLNWYPSEPNNKGSEDCAEVILGESDGKNFNGRWNDRSCQKLGAFVCEKLG